MFSFCIYGGVVSPGDSQPFACKPDSRKSFFFAAVAPAQKLPITLPTESTADVTLRRLQKFKVLPGKTYAWAFGTSRSGKLQPDPAGLLTFPQLVITDMPMRLTLKATE